MMPGSVKIYAKVNKLEPATCYNLDWFGFGYLEQHVIHVPFEARCEHAM
jgi:hypothetical protein